jgi:hypothetical protein
MARHYIGEINRQDIRYRDLFGIPGASPEPSNVFAGDVGGECPLCSNNIVRSTTRAFLVVSISDDPLSCSSAALSKPQSGAFACTRHSRLIRSIAEIVV